MCSSPILSSRVLHFPDTLTLCSFSSIACGTKSFRFVRNDLVVMHTSHCRRGIRLQYSWFRRASVYCISRRLRPRGGNSDRSASGHLSCSWWDFRSAILVIPDTSCMYVAAELITFLCHVWACSQCFSGALVHTLAMRTSLQSIILSYTDYVFVSA